jgi:hypothetical protein
MSTSSLEAKDKKVAHATTVAVADDVIVVEKCSNATLLAHLMRRFAEPAADRSADECSNASLLLRVIQLNKGAVDLSVEEEKKDKREEVGTEKDKEDEKILDERLRIMEGAMIGLQHRNVARKDCLGVALRLDFTLGPKLAVFFQTAVLCFTLYIPPDFPNDGISMSASVYIHSFTLQSPAKGVPDFFFHRRYSESPLTPDAKLKLQVWFNCVCMSMKAVDVDVCDSSHNGIGAKCKSLPNIISNRRNDPALRELAHVLSAMIYAWRADGGSMAIRCEVAEVEPATRLADAIELMGPGLAVPVVIDSSLAAKNQLTRAVRRGLIYGLSDDEDDEDDKDDD